MNISVADADSIQTATGQPRGNGKAEEAAGAIRQALLAHPGVRACALLDRADQTGLLRRVAYVVADEAVEEAALRALLSAFSLAERPEAFAWVSAIPYSPDGQVDEAKLAAMPVLDAETVDAWKECLAEASPATRVSVRLTERRSPLAMLSVNAANAQAGAAPGGPASREMAVGEADAISIGAPATFAGAMPGCLAELLLQAAADHGQQLCVFIQPGGESVQLTYSELLERGRRVRAGLRDEGLQAGDKAIILCRGNVEIVSAFWGCVLAGVVPVPVSAPGSDSADDTNLVKLRNTLELLGHPIVIADDGDRTPVHAALAAIGVAEVRLAGIGSLLAHEAENSWHRAASADPAVMLLTSGSTGRPKAVVQPHANLIRQMRGSAAAMRLDSKDVTLNWFALDHVGGLIMFHARDVMLGCRQIHAPTQLVIGNPLVWLDWIQQHRVTLSWAPNFAFGLVNRAMEHHPDRSWDLSSLRVLINAGEAIVRETAQRFLRTAMRFGAPAGVIRPAWGMSETCSAVTFATLEPAEPGASGDEPVDVGRPIAGVRIRIVDADDRVLKEGQVGRLQIGGDTTTTGYFGNPAANAESFTDDGWMITGDLGYLCDGSLTIAGRNKDVVIINGLNIHCHEMEAVVEGVAGVSASFAAAVPVRGGDSEDLAIFIHSELPAEQTRNLLARVRQALVAAFGVNPRYVLPIAREEFSKTAIGKLQRMPLRDRLEAGDFAGLIEATGQGHREASAVPDWFFRRDWLRKSLPRPRPALAPACTLVFADQHGFATSLRIGEGVRVTVDVAADFRRTSAVHYGLDPAREDHYRLLLESLARDHLRPDQVIHCWSYGERLAAKTDGSHLLDAHALGFGSICCLLRALPDGVPVGIRAFSSGAQPVGATIAFERSTLLGLTATVGAEFPHVEYRHVDFDATPAAADVEDASAELHVAGEDAEVVYRERERLVPGLRRVGWEAVSATGAGPFEPDGCYLITGGLGGLGMQLATLLLKKYRARLLLLGRDELEPRSKPASAGSQEKLDRLGKLRALGGSVCYKAADVADPASLAVAIAEGELELGKPTNGVIHLAGVFGSVAISDRANPELDAILRPKLLGTWNLHAAFAQRPDVFFVTSSATVSLFRGVGMAAYAGANSFVESFSTHLSARRRVNCIGWSLWDEVGMGRGLATKALMERQGYIAMKPQLAMLSWELLVRGDEACVFAGLNPGAGQVRERLHGEVEQTRELVAYVSGTPAVADLPPVLDAFGCLVPCRFHAVSESAFDEHGELRAEAIEGVREGRSAVAIAPLETPTQRALAELWSEILSTEVSSRDDNFFELGGSSLRAAELLVAVHGKFGKRFTFATVVSEPTIAAMARLIDGKREGGGAAVTRHIVALNTRGELPPFFGMHPLFGLVYPYAELARLLAPQQPFYALQARGFQRGERPHASMQELAADYCTAIRGVQPHGPYFIGGWSLGSLIALEVAQQLQQAGESVACLAIIDQATDSMERFLDQTPLRTRLGRFGQVLDNAMRSYDPCFARHRGVLGAVRAPIRFLRFLNAVFVPMLKVGWACNKIARDYVIKPYAGRISLLHTDDPELTHIEDQRWGWEQVARDGVDVYRISGDHFNLHEYPHVGQLASQLREALESCRGPHGARGAVHPG